MTFTSDLGQIRKLHSTWWFVHEALLLHDLFGNNSRVSWEKPCCCYIESWQKVNKRDLLILCEKPLAEVDSSFSKDGWSDNKKFWSTVTSPHWYVGSASSTLIGYWDPNRVHSFTPMIREYCLVFHCLCLLKQRPKTAQTEGDELCKELTTLP